MAPCVVIGERAADLVAKMVSRLSELAERFWAAVESSAVQSKPPGA